MTQLEHFRKEINFRDLGGYCAADGRKIRSGLLYRSGAPGLLSPEELEHFRNLGIRTILDFRSSKACAELPDPVIEGCEQIQMCAAFENFRDDLNDSPREFYEMLIDEDQHGNMAATVVSSIHASLVYSNEAYKLMFRKLLDNAVPLLFHCSQGKDRTGIAAILIMLALGIDEDQIRSDYLLSNEYRKPLIDKRMQSMKLLHRFSENIKTAILAAEGVLPEAVHMILAEILERYGTYENFLLQEYDLTEEDLTKLRDLYLEP
ncbi:MAG: tyrosine-protein phosphatase [Solobacterium sp.]|nr:tyrosine-protein phosphatase [Solobacterium sp.]